MYGINHNIPIPNVNTASIAHPMNESSNRNKFPLFPFISLALFTTHSLEDNSGLSYPMKYAKEYNKPLDTV